LREAGEEPRARNRHLAWLVEQAEQAEIPLWGADQQRWLEWLHTDLDNIRAALSWSLLAPAQREAGLRLAAALPLFWVLDDCLREGLDWLDRLLADAPAGRSRAKA